MSYNERFDETFNIFLFVTEHWINHPLYFTAGVTSASCIPLAGRDDGQMLQASLLFLFTNSLHKYFCPPAAANEDAIKLNKTLRTQDETLEKSIPELQSEADRMIAELRSRELNMQERIAQDELK